MKIKEPFHDGELLIQQRANEAEIAQRNGAVIADVIPKGALRFIQQQALAVVGSLDSDGHVWASVLVGEPGFLSATDQATVALDVTQNRSSADDPLWHNIETRHEVGMLVIELATRKRLRINGQLGHRDNAPFELSVRQAYPNCPKFIQRRHLSALPSEPTRPVHPTCRGTELEDAQRALIAAADTLFVASAHPEHGVDASHRGGRPGFVRILNPRRMRIPDYPGNSMFNTLGNFAVYPRAGLVFLDFDNSRTLQLTGRVEMLWDQHDAGDETGGTCRYWEFEIEHWIESALPRQLRWELLDYSPHNPVAPSAMSNEATSLRLRVLQTTQEAHGIRSFRLGALDGAELPAFAPGAHLPVHIRLADGKEVIRHYSILSSPNERRHYEIAVLLEADGRGGSRFMHEQLQADDVLDAELPRNDFPLATDATHNILIAGGIGITPILSMLRSLMHEQASLELHYAARSAKHLAYQSQVTQLAGDKAQLYLSEGPAAARLNFDELLSTPKKEHHVYVCGPVRMIEAVRGAAARAGWSPDQIHFESFGLGSTAANREIQVRLARADRTVRVPASQTILEALLDAGVTVPYECQRGECGMCATGLVSGEPDHRDVCLSSDERGHSMCVCVSRAKGDRLLLDL